MSTYVMAACWPLQMSPTAKSVLIALADQANDQGVCWPAVATICTRTCLSERTVRTTIRWLQDNHALTIEEQRGTSSRYTLTPADFGGPVQELLPGISRRGATDAPPSCKSRRGGVRQMQGGGAGAAPKPTENLQGTVTEPSVSSARAGDGISFAMTLDWKPDPNTWALYAVRAGIAQHELTDEVLTEFTGHWHADGRVQTEKQWVHKLITRIKSTRSRAGPRDVSRGTSRPPPVALAAHDNKKPDFRAGMNADGSIR
ncbi:MAG: DnaT-like ssDNA-binding domain-containing protein [Pseudomonadota bacterium]